MGHSERRPNPEGEVVSTVAAPAGAAPAAHPVDCQMDPRCADSVTHIDQSGYLYCTKHGLQRRASRPCRKLRPHELTRLENGGQITKY